ncbi:MAG: hypothetical protein R8F63_02240 [Acidimicrobiales bacterium]|nr:hypothetical protein [Acidimicrobiales bacterium]
MDVLVALHSAAALLLLVAGVAKIVRPAPTGDLLATLGLPGSDAVAVGVGGVETVVGVVALAVGGPLTAALVGAFYVAFAGIVVRAMRAGAASCGCFGRVDAPPSWIHVIGNAALAAVSFAAIAGDAPVEVMEDQPAGGVGFVLVVGVLAGLALVAFTALPEAMGARRPGPARPEFRIDGDAS